MLDLAEKQDIYLALQIKEVWDENTEIHLHCTWAEAVLAAKAAALLTGKQARLSSGPGFRASGSYFHPQSFTGGPITSPLDC